MDLFSAMRTFVRIVERRSFTKAAEDLGVPRSTATEAVKALEARLRVQLRTGGSTSTWSGHSPGASSCRGCAASSTPTPTSSC
jgi:Bacterial regulatory helix-turn-helix protein, lysR family